MAARANRTERSPAGIIMPILFVVCLTLVVFAGLAVLPAKTWFSQREKTAEAEAEIARLEAETVLLEQELRLLATDEEIERRARKDFDLVYPGEESYRIQQPSP
ncbi:MAG: septum formation initiator family protein [Actinomycetota bacterium]